jgi:DNA primase
VVVEGNFDVIASHQAGVKQVVATAGTALTEQHLKALGLLTKDIRLCFDADKAGLAATERAIPLSSKQNLNISVITIPSGKDADELLKKDKKAWIGAIETPSYALDWLMDHYKQQIDLAAAPGKRQYTDLLLPVVNSLSDAVERDHYVNKLAKLLEVSPLALNSKLADVKEPNAKAKLPLNIQSQEIDKAEVEKLKVQDNLLSLMLVQKRLRDQLGVLTPEMFLSDNGRDIFEILANKPDLDIKEDIQLFKNLTDYVKIEVLLYEELYSGLDISELKYEASRLTTRLVESYIKNQKEILTDQLQTADSVTTRKLLEKAKRLDSLLNQVKREGSFDAQEATS